MTILVNSLNLNEYAGYLYIHVRIGITFLRRVFDDHQDHIPFKNGQ